MNKKLIILTTAAVAAVAAFGVIGSGAWFTDSERVEVDASSASLDIQLEVKEPGPAGGCATFAGTADNGTPVSWDLTNLAPGDVRIRCINVQNKPSPASTLPVKYRYRTENAVGDPTLLAANLTVSRGFCVDAGITSPTVIYSGSVLGLTGGNIDGTEEYVGDDGSWNGTLPVNTTHCYEFRITIPDSLGNGFQGRSGSFDIAVDATQEANPGWAQVPTTVPAPAAP